MLSRYLLYFPSMKFDIFVSPCCLYKTGKPFVG